MRVHTFIGKVTPEALRQLDTHINNWLEDNHIEPAFVHQTFGYEEHREVSNTEPVIVTSIWYKTASRDR